MKSRFYEASHPHSRLSLAVIGTGWTFALVCGSMLLLAHSAHAQKPLNKGLHFVFDASASMCGYLKPADPDKAMLTIIRRATSLSDSEKNNRVLLIRQRTAKSGPGDLDDAPPNFQALVNDPSAKSCAPFDGRDSNLDVVFSTQPKHAPARSLVLISDMQLDEPALTRFVDRARSWLRLRNSSAYVSAGIVTVSAPFLGKYYPESDPPMRDKGYLMPQHVRPLSLVWFVDGIEDAATVRSLLVELGISTSSNKSLYGLQVLPFETKSAALWLQPAPTIDAASKLFAATSYNVVVPGEVRKSNDVSQCPHTQWLDGKLQVDLTRPCRDGKPFFDSVQSADLILSVDKTLGLSIADAGPLKVQNGAVIMPLPRKGPATQEAQLTLAAGKGDLDVKEASVHSVDNDTCTMRVTPGSAEDVDATWQTQCVAKLAGKTYRYDALVEEFLLRARDVANERLAPLPLKVIIKR